LSKLDTYLARLMAWPFFATLTVSAMLLLLVRLVEMMDFVFDQGGSVQTVAQLLGSLAPQYLSLAIPLALLLSTGFALRTLALNSEADVLSAIGMSPARIIRVPIIAAASLTIALTLLIGWIQPISSYSFEQLRYDLRVGALGTIIKRGVFQPYGDRVVIRVGDFDEKNRVLRDVFAYGRATDTMTQYISAKEAQLMRTEDKDTIIARLMDGRILFADQTGKRTSSLVFERYDMAVKLPNTPIFRGRGVIDRESTLPELIAKFSSNQATTKAHKKALTGLSRRSAQVISLFAIPFLCFGMAMPGRRSSNPGGLILALATYLVYNEFSLFGERSATNGGIDPIIGQIIPLTLFYTISISSFILRGSYGGSAFMARIGSAIRRYRQRIMARLKPFIPKALSTSGDAR
jgi:lipopolysaccharide export system permease protein